MEWQPLETAFAPPFDPKADDPGLGVQNCLAVANGRYAIGVIRSFTGSDGTVRKGIQQGFGIFVPTHWMRLPEPPA